jgi:hypothetical protein
MRTTAAQLADFISAAVEGARRRDPVAFVEAAHRLAGLDADQVGVVQAATIRSLLEQEHPDGLAADDVRDLLIRCERGAEWFPAFDPAALLLVLSGALGVIDPEQKSPTGRQVLAMHACVVIADLSHDSKSVGVQLDSAVQEIRRAETMEMP